MAVTMAELSKSKCNDSSLILPTISVSFVTAWLTLVFVHSCHVRACPITVGRDSYSSGKSDLLDVVVSGVAPEPK